MPKVSIGMPVYNGDRYLGSAIESLLSQTFTDFSLVVVDNASTDGTEAIGRELAKRDKRVRYHRNPENIGGGPNFNRAFDMANDAPYFKWAAHDDLHGPDFLAECVAVLDRRSDVVLCHCETEHIDENGAVFEFHDPELPAAGDERPSARFRNLVMSRNFCIDMFGVIRRAALAKTPRIATYVGADRPMLAELGLLGRFYRVPRALFQNRDHPGRSIKGAPLQLRGGWYSSKLIGKVALLNWRHLREYAAAIERTPLAPRERMACYAALAEWAVLDWERLVEDLRIGFDFMRKKYGLGDLAGQLLKATSGSGPRTSTDV
jgi:glycosyltransferase involved in cell wall biosynthesis